jgi:serine O-acetyltransferase
MFKNIKYNLDRTLLLDPSAHSKIEVLLLYPHIKALFFYRISRFFYLRKLYFISKFISNIGKFLTGIEIHAGAKIGRGLVIDHGFGVVIGETAIIEDDVLIYHGVTLGGTGKEKGKRHPTVKSGSIIGAGAKCLGNITIGINVRVGANAVVIKDIDSGKTVVGVPAREIVKNDH